MLDKSRVLRPGTFSTEIKQNSNFSTGASKVLLDDHVHEALQKKSDEAEDEHNAQANFYVSDEDREEDEYVSFSGRRK